MRARDAHDWCASLGTAIVGVKQFLLSSSGSGAPNSDGFERSAEALDVSDAA
jgi:hypothetical protein